LDQKESRTLEKRERMCRIDQDINRNDQDILT
jgi:hypothetical protein